MPCYLVEASKFPQQSGVAIVGASLTFPVLALPLSILKPLPTRNCAHQVAKKLELHRDKRLKLIKSTKQCEFSCNPTNAASPTYLSVVLFSSLTLRSHMENQKKFRTTSRPTPDPPYSGTPHTEGQVYTIFKSQFNSIFFSLL